VAGAFVGLDKIIEKRQVKKPALGLAGKVEKSKAVTEKSAVEVLGGIEPEDLSKFGIIPELIGRLPVNAMLEELDESALVQILTEPKNALTKQYQKLFEFENVKLKFTDGAFRAVAQKAIKRKTGARGLRAVLEDSMLDIMFEIP